MSKQHKWMEEDEVIAISVYLEYDNISDADKNGTRLINLRSQRDKVLGVNSINRKLQNCRFLDGIGNAYNCSKRHKKAWAEYRNAPEKLKKRMAEIIASLPD